MNSWVEILGGVLRYVVFAFMFIIIMNLVTDDVPAGLIFMGGMLYAAIMDVKHSVDYPKPLDNDEDV